MTNLDIVDPPSTMADLDMVEGRDQRCPGWSGKKLDMESPDLKFEKLELRALRTWFW